MDVVSVYLPGQMGTQRFMCNDLSEMEGGLLTHRKDFQAVGGVSEDILPDVCDVA
jgi:hypothetical protein